MFLLLMAATVASVDVRCSARVGFYQPHEGIVSTSETAAQVAEVYLNNIYGAPTIQRELPLRVGLDRGVWKVEGKRLPVYAVGGVAEIQICKSNGLVLRLVHGK